MGCVLLMSNDGSLLDKSAVSHSVVILEALAREVNLCLIRSR